MTFPAYPQRMLTEEEVETYRRDGVIMIKGLLDDNWLSLIEAGLEEARETLSPVGQQMSNPEGGYVTDLYMWKHVDAIRDLIYYSPFSRWAQQVMGSEQVRFFYDQMFIKEAGSGAPTPWHHDMTFWPLGGHQLCSFWMALEPVTRESSGLQYVKGSHLWSNRFKAISPDYNEVLLAEEGLDDVPDINADPDQYDSVCWDMDPGDVLIFHPLTLHGSSSNTSLTNSRRALALRWLGDDVTYQPSATRMLFPYAHRCEPDGPVQGAAFPRILPEYDAEERSMRAHGPEMPDPSLLAEGMQAREKAGASLKAKGVDKDEIKKELEQTW